MAYPQSPSVTFAFALAVTLAPKTTRFETPDPERSPATLDGEARETDLDVTASAVTSPPKSETELTRTSPRPTERSSSTVAFVPPVIGPVTTAPSPYDQPTRDAAACGGDEIDPADVDALPGTTTLTPKALAE